MNREIDREIGIHGGRWESLHGGYFSDPVIAGIMVEEVIDVIDKAKPSVLADLGGGTGCLLSRLRDGELSPDLRLVNLDLSPRQLSRAEKPGISTIQASLSGFSRDLVASRGDRLLCIMRSALHYAGKVGLLPALRHIRAQMAGGNISFIRRPVSPPELKRTA